MLITQQFNEVVSFVKGVRSRLPTLSACKIHILGTDVSSLNENCQSVLHMHKSLTVHIDQSRSSCATK